MKPKTGCLWKLDNNDGSYDTACDEKFEFTNGGPSENGFNFCPYCGNKIWQPADVEVREGRGQN